MTKTHRVLATLAFAAGASALAAPAANASVLPVGPGAQGPSLLSQVDDLATSGVDEEYRSQVPRVTEQFGGLSGVQQLGQLRQVVAPVAPVLGLVPGI
ncbi:hypothetical protein J5J01_25775 [Streptomyces fradiae]|uniref:hypothetical protein n=1 Tax=Streptomyces fradiae TaxID=1906 RepID=UPI002018E739|nr:hypothetical protein [Streptomyces fradiae]UQS30189.1 hypothetical protein J5J01_25775 [Streptomyces fradiae]